MATRHGAVRASIHVYNINVMNKGNKMKSNRNSWKPIYQSLSGRAMALVFVLVALVFMTIILTSCSNVQVEPVLRYGSNSDDNQGGVRLHIPF